VGGRPARGRQRRARDGCAAAYRPIPQAEMIMQGAARRQVLRHRATGHFHADRPCAGGRPACTTECRAGQVHTPHPSGRSGSAACCGHTGHGSRRSTSPNGDPFAGSLPMPTVAETGLPVREILDAIFYVQRSSIAPRLMSDSSLADRVLPTCQVAHYSVWEPSAIVGHAQPPANRRSC